MRIFEKKEAKALSIGLYVKFARSNSNIAKCTQKRIGAWQRELTICIPDGNEVLRPRQICHFINIVQDGNCWPLRIDWASAKDFLTLEQVASIEYLLEDVPVYVYGVPDTSKRSIDIDKLYNAKIASRKREMRAKGG